MSTARTIEYTVEHTADPVFDVSNDRLAQALRQVPVLMVVDDGLWSSFGTDIERYTEIRLNSLGLLRLQGSERTKSLEDVAALCSAAFEKRLPRNGAFVAVGGGTILDVVGFAASIYRRGVSYVRVPTTLIGMIDVGVGIKQAINFENKKNLLGSFYPPQCTINDARFLHQLPKRELTCGIAEALKIALVCDDVLFAMLEDNARILVSSGFRSPALVAMDVLIRAEKAMMRQLATNLYEQDLRRLVDFGHSFSPVIETTSNFTVAHGEAVGIDILMSTALAIRRNMCNGTLLPRLIRIYHDIGLPVTHPSISPLLMERALADVRAHRGGALNLVVPTEIGRAEFLQEISYDDIAVALTMIAAAS